MTELNIPKLITVEQLADELGLSIRQVWKLSQQGIIPVVHVGRQLRFNPEAISKWIADGGRGFQKGKG